MTAEEQRKELKLLIDYIPEERLSEAIIAVDNLLEFNEAAKKDLIEAMDMNNLLGPYSSFEEMMQDALQSDDDQNL